MVEKRKGREERTSECKDGGGKERRDWTREK